MAKVLGAVLLVVAVTVSLSVGLWPCETGFSGRGVGSCQDIDECKVICLYIYIYKTEFLELQIIFRKFFVTDLRLMI